VILLEEVEHWYFTLDDETVAAVTGARGVESQAMTCNEHICGGCSVVAQHY
jgi:hypothetical protein